MGYDIFDFDSRHPKYQRGDVEDVEQVLKERLFKTLYKRDVEPDQVYVDWLDTMGDIITAFNDDNGTNFFTTDTLKEYVHWKHQWSYLWKQTKQI